MVKKYIYKDVKYDSQHAVRQAIFEYERKAFGVEPQEAKAEFWANLGVIYTEEPDPEPTEEQLALQVRRKRDSLLRETDYMVLSDYPIDAETLEKVKTYRQSLRDITTQEGFPKSVIWPAKGW